MLKAIGIISRLWHFWAKNGIKETNIWSNNEI